MRVNDTKVLRGLDEGILECMKLGEILSDDGMMMSLGSSCLNPLYLSILEHTQDDVIDRTSKPVKLARCHPRHVSLAPSQ